MNVAQTILSYLGGVSILAALGLLLFRATALAAVDSLFDKKLEAYKHRLDLSQAAFEAELRKQVSVLEMTLDFEYQKRLKDFGLFTAERHANYPAIYRTFLEAQSLMMGLYGFVEYPDFSVLSAEEAEIYLRERGISKREREQVCACWAKPLPRAVQSKLQILLRERQKLEARRAFEQARNLCLRSGLFLSHDVDEICRAISVHMGRYLASSRFEQYNGTSGYEERQRLEVGIADDLEKLKKAMQRELAGATPAQTD